MDNNTNNQENANSTEPALTSFSPTPPPQELPVTPPITPTVPAEPIAAAPASQPATPVTSPLPATDPVPPAVPASTPPASIGQVVSSQPTSPKRLRFRKKPALLLLGAALLIVIILGSYHFGTKSMKSVAATTSMTAMAVPQGATIIEQCEPGLGTQYVLPKDIPNGPVYNVYQGKLIGTEYMVSSKSLQTLNTSINNLPLFGQAYDHINIMSMDAHAGFPEPHFQVDVMMVPKSVSDKITCGTGSSTPAMTNPAM